MCKGDQQLLLNFQRFLLWEHSHSEAGKLDKEKKETQKNLVLKFLFPACKAEQAYEADSCFKTDLHIFLYM